MKKLFSRFIPLSLLVSLAMSMIPSPVYAQAPAISSITPNTIVNDVVNVITVSGVDFDNTAAVLLDGGALTTSFLNAQTLTATIPAGVAAGNHQITVTMTSYAVAGSVPLTVLAPTPVPTATATTAPLPFVRPQFVVNSSKVSGSVATNESFKLNFVIGNAGTATAYSVQAVFSSADLVPLKNGGIAVAGTVDEGGQVNIPQHFQVTGQLWGKSLVTIDVAVTYYDAAGTSYTDKFTLSIPTTGGGGSGVVYPTSTPTGVKTSQLVITSYAASVDPLQPGEQFTLTMTVQNMGNVRAQRVTMIVGGGSSGTSGGTPQPGGVSGGSGEFTNFAPVGASNVQSLGELGAGDMIQAKQNLIVNVSTSPGAYPMKVTFSYLDEKNEVFNDEQVITLLIYSLPNVDVSFYRPPDPFVVGQPGALPIQVVNIGKRSAVLGNLTLESDAGMLENGTGLIGSIDAGGYFTIDSMFTPEKSGPITLDVTIDYTDDFNQARTLKRTLKIEVMEGMMEDPMLDPSMQGGGGGGEEFPVMTEETGWQKVWRFILGIFGLDSAPDSGGGEEIPPVEEEIVPQIKPGSGKG